MRLSAGRISANMRRTRPAYFVPPFTIEGMAGLTYRWRGDTGVTLNRQGPLYPSQPSQTHARGLHFDATDQKVRVDSVVATAVDTNPAATITICCKITDEATDKFLYFEDGPAGGNIFYIRSSAPGSIRVLFRDSSGDPINNTTATFTDGTHFIFSLVLDDAATGYGTVGDGVAKVALGTAYAIGPGASDNTFADMGVSFKGSDNLVYAVRHTSALSLAQVRQVQQYVADAVAADIGTITISGSEVANANSPQDEWKFDEDADGYEAANSGTASTIGQRLPGDTISSFVDSVGALDFLMATEAKQPKFIDGPSGTNSQKTIKHDGVDDKLRLAQGAGMVLDQPYTLVFLGIRLFGGNASSPDTLFMNAGNEAVRLKADGTRWEMIAGVDGNMGPPDVEGSVAAVYSGAASKGYSSGGFDSGDIGANNLRANDNAQTIGAHGSVDAYEHLFSWSEFLAIAGEVSPATLADLSAYAQDRYGDGALVLA